MNGLSGGEAFTAYGALFTRGESSARWDRTAALYEPLNAPNAEDVGEGARL